MSRRILVISSAFVFTFIGTLVIGTLVIGTFIIGLFIWMSQGKTVVKSDLTPRNTPLPSDSIISWKTPTVRIVAVPTEDALGGNIITPMTNEPISNISPLADIPGTALPSAPPLAKWELTRDIIDDNLKMITDGVFQTDDSKNTFNIHGIVIEGKIITVFFSTNIVPSNKTEKSIKSDNEKKTVKPKTIQLKSGNKKETATSIIILGEMENVVFGAFTVPIPEKYLSQLDLEISDVVVEDKKGKKDEILVNWNIPFLKDNNPEDAGTYTRQIMLTKPYDVVYDKIRVFESNSTKSINTGFGGRPDVNDGIMRFFVFTLKSPTEEQGIYIFLMADGSIKTSTEKEYLEEMKKFFTRPTPVPQPSHDSIDAQWTPEPTPVNPPPPVTLEEMIKQATSDATTK